MPDLMYLLERTGALIEGHFVFAPNKHSNAWINNDIVYSYTWEYFQLCKELARDFIDLGIEVVVGPETSGAILAYAVGYQLNQMNHGIKVLSSYAEKSDNNLYLICRAFENLISDKKALVVNDVLITGNSISRVIKAVTDMNGKVEGIGVFFNCGGISESIFNVSKVITLFQKELSVWDAENCPLCQNGVPINKIK